MPHRRGNGLCSENTIRFMATEFFSRWKLFSFPNFMKTCQNLIDLSVTFKVSKSIEFEKGLLEQFPHISMTNFAVLFLSENFKRENSNFRKYNAYFFYFLWYHDLSLYKKACLHNLCMNHALLDHESDRLSWTSTTLLKVCLENQVSCTWLIILK